MFEIIEPTSKRVRRGLMGLGATRGIDSSGGAICALMSMGAASKSGVAERRADLVSVRLGSGCALVDGAGSSSRSVLNVPLGGRKASGSSDSSNTASDGGRRKDRADAAEVLHQCGISEYIFSNRANSLT